MDFHSAANQLEGDAELSRQTVVRDIREDLFERMEAATAEMAEARTAYDQERRNLEQRFQRVFEDISNRQRALSVLLDEEHRAHGPFARPIPQQKEMRLPLADFILNGVASAGPMSKDDVKDMVERAGYGGAEGVGRMVHTTLLNLKNSNKLQQRADGSYEVEPVFLGAVAELFTSTKDHPFSEDHD